jgi:hypothetical protein
LLSRFKYFLKGIDLCLNFTPAWPQPIWGKAPAKNYTAQQFDERVTKIQNALIGDSFAVF